VDNGIGFEDEYAEKIFAPFQRLHSRDQYEGTGIGLAVCRRIVERHNGVIEASSIPSKRTIFSIVIPASNRLISIKYATTNH
jgi:light-regulated signal transduction histidine kinase (bacteriophytochrome)